MENANVAEFTGIDPADLELCFAGMSHCEPSHSYGPAVRPNYLLHIVIQGKGRFIQNEMEFSLHANQGFLIVPDQLTFYQADQEDPWEYMWIGFRGSRATSILRELDLNEKHPVFSCQEIERLHALILEMIHLSGSDLSTRLHRDALILEFFSVFTKAIRIELLKKEISQDEYIRQAIHFIQGNYDQPIHIRDVATFVGIDRTYLYSLFVENLKVTPTVYLKTYRLTRAKELLKVTDLSIAQIAQSCGYRDPLVFSKSFRQTFGITPTAWRKTRNQSCKTEFKTEEGI